mgnify:FL=1
MYIGCEYLGIILGSIAGGVILGILEAMIIKMILENYFSKLCKQYIFGNITVNSHTNYQRNHVWNRLRLL